MRKVCRLAREVLDITAAELRPGITTDYLDEVCHKACVARDVGVTRIPVIYIHTYIFSNTKRPILLL